MIPSSMRRRSWMIGEKMLSHTEKACCRRIATHDASRRNSWNCDRQKKDARKNKKPPVQQGVFLEWLGAGLNRRHQDFQSCALPTELPSRSKLGRILVQNGDDHTRLCWFRNRSPPRFPQTDQTLLGIGNSRSNCQSRTVTSAASRYCLAPIF